MVDKNFPLCFNQKKKIWFEGGKNINHNIRKTKSNLLTPQARKFLKSIAIGCNDGFNLKRFLAFFQLTLLNFGFCGLVALIGVIWFGDRFGVGQFDCNLLALFGLLKFGGQWGSGAAPSTLSLHRTGATRHCPERSNYWVPFLCLLLWSPDNGPGHDPLTVILT